MTQIWRFPHIPLAAVMVLKISVGRPPVAVVRVFEVSLRTSVTVTVRRTLETRFRRASMVGFVRVLHAGLGRPSVTDVRRAPLVGVVAVLLRRVPVGLGVGVALAAV